MVLRLRGGGGERARSSCGKRGLCEGCGLTQPKLPGGSGLRNPRAWVSAAETEVVVAAVRAHIAANHI